MHRRSKSLIRVGEKWLSTQKLERLSSFCAISSAEFHGFAASTGIEKASHSASSRLVNFPNLQTRNVVKVVPKEDPKMFCFQCEQTKNRRGCTQIGVCGKVPEVAKLQDLLIYSVKGLAIYAHRVEELGLEVDPKYAKMVVDALFMTVTNVNFDPDRFPPMIQQVLKARDELKAKFEKICKESNRDYLIASETSGTPATYKLPEGEENNTEVLAFDGDHVGVTSYLYQYGGTVRGVREMIVYGLKGAAAYYAHANRLGKEDKGVEKAFFKILSKLETAPKEERHDLGKNLEWALEVGAANLKVLELLDAGHKDQLGVPTPAEVTITPVEGKCILISGHDMNDLEQILKYTEGKGINVFTHGEMLPAHGYPELKKYKHLAGHYGGGWQLQQYEFPSFPGAICITTNCLVEPRPSYKNRIFTLNATGWPGTPHLDTENPDHIQQIVDCALQQKGFTAEDVNAVERKTLTVGFGHDAVLSHADTVIEAVKSGALKRVFVVGGCDGSENKRSYFTEFVDHLPEDTLVLTMGCAKYRFNRLRDYGTLGDSGIPRMLDMGQCNDSYGAVKVALALADAFKTDINSLPLTLSISWFEQKAVAVLLTLLHLGIKNIHLGPVMPAFLTEEVVDILHEKFNLSPIELRNRRDVIADVNYFMEVKN